MSKPLGAASVRRAAQRSPAASPQSVNVSQNERSEAANSAGIDGADRASLLSRFISAEELKVIGAIAVLVTALVMIFNVFSNPQHAEFKNAAWSLLVAIGAAAATFMFGRRTRN